MFCTKCGTQLPDESVFCSACGAKVAIHPQTKEQDHEQPPLNEIKKLPPLEFQVCQQTVRLDGSYKEFTIHRNQFFTSYYTYCNQQTGTLQKNANADNLLGILEAYGLSVIGWIFDKCVEFLISNGVYHASRDNLIDSCPAENSHFSEIYSELQEKYIAIVASEEELAAYQRATKAYKGSWQGGGFGLKGALKGAATAGALNVADKALNRLGGAITGSMERSRIRKQKETIFNSKDWIEECRFALDDDAEMIYEVAYQILCYETDAIMPPIDTAKSDTYIDNLQKIGSEDQRIKILLLSIAAYPYEPSTYWMLMIAIKNGIHETGVYQLVGTFLPLDDVRDFLAKVRSLQMQAIDRIPDTTYPDLDKKISKLQAWITFLDENAPKIDCLKEYQKQYKSIDAAKLQKLIQQRHTSDDGTYFESLEELNLYQADTAAYEKLIHGVSSVLSLEKKKIILQKPMDSLSGDDPIVKTKIFQEKLKQLYEWTVLQENASNETKHILEQLKSSNNLPYFFNKLVSLAQGGGMEAQYALSEIYRGIGPQVVVKDDGEAFKWCKLAAQQGYGPAQRRLGYLYYEGIGTEKDAVESKNWYQEAIDTYKLPAQRGDPVAQCILGQIYEDDRYPMHNSITALSLYQSAAEQNCADAQFRLGCYYDRKKDRERAKDWYTRAAKQGHGWAQYDLASGIYTKDWSERGRLYIGAAESGVLQAQREVALLYESGRFVEKDLEKALMWYERAAAQGDDSAKKDVERLRSIISSQSEAEEKSSTIPAKNSETVPVERASAGTSQNSNEANSLQQLIQEERELEKQCQKLFAENPTLNKALKKANSSALIFGSYLFAVISIFIGLLPIGILVVIIAHAVKKQRNKRYEKLFYATASDELKAACQARYEAQEKRNELEKGLKNH